MNGPKGVPFGRPMKYPFVAIGASAGGLEAVSELLAAVPAIGGVLSGGDSAGSLRQLVDFIDYIP